MKITVEFSGGLEIAFDKQKTLAIEIPAEQEKFTLADLIIHLKEKYIKGKTDFFVVENDLRPGILVLINDTDWELEGKGEYQLQDKDVIAFISTLHGG